MERVLRDRHKKSGIQKHARLIVLVTVLLVLIIWWVTRKTTITWWWLDTKGNQVFSVSFPEGWLESPDGALRPPHEWGKMDAIFARNQKVGFPPTVWIKVEESGKKNPDILKAEKAQIENLNNYKMISRSKIDLKETTFERVEYTYRSPFVGVRVGARDVSSDRGFLFHAIEISTVKDKRYIKLTAVTREKDFENNHKDLEKCLLSLRFK